MKRKYRMGRASLQRATKNARVAAGDRGREICGLLVDVDGHLVLIEVRNAVRRGGAFELNSADVRSVVRAAGALKFEVVGTYHSHPLYVAMPGEADVANAVDDSLMLIIDVLGRKAALWRIRRKKKTKLAFTVV